LKDLKLASEVMNTVRFSKNLRPILLEPPSKKSIFVIAPHPDDEILGPGGTLIQAIDAGSTVKVLYLTSGLDNEHEVREREALAVSEDCGFTCVFLKGNANAIELTDGLVNRLSKELGAFRPDIIMLPFLLDDNDDHRLASELLMDALDTGGAAAKSEIWAYQVYSALYPNVVVDITPVVNRKQMLIRKFTSQMERRRWDLFSLGLNAWNIRFVSGRPDIESIESFFVAPMSEYRAICQPYFKKPS
jgi:N-acetylglucosamine malate deacetylase 1